MKILDDSFREVWQASENVNVPEGTSVLKEEIGTYAIPHTYREKYFFVIVSLTDEYGKVISHAEYWPRTIKLMEDEAYYQKFVSEPIESVSYTHLDVYKRQAEDGNKSVVMGIRFIIRHAGF